MYVVNYLDYFIVGLFARNFLKYMKKYIHQRFIYYNIHGLADGFEKYRSENNFI